MIIEMSKFKEQKELKAKALKYARAYGVNINTVMDAMKEVADTEVTTTTIITEQEALEALGDNYITPEQLVKYGLMEEQAIGTLNDNVSSKLNDGDYATVDIGIEEYAKQHNIIIIPVNPDIEY